jgi:hypothetical protein
MSRITDEQRLTKHINTSLDSLLMFRALKDRMAKRSEKALYQTKRRKRVKRKGAA